MQYCGFNSSAVVCRILEDACQAGLSTLMGWCVCLPVHMFEHTVTTTDIQYICLWSLPPVDNAKHSISLDVAGLSECVSTLTHPADRPTLTHPADRQYGKSGRLVSALSRGAPPGAKESVIDLPREDMGDKGTKMVETFDSSSPTLETVPMNNIRARLLCPYQRPLSSESETAFKEPKTTVRENKTYCSSEEDTRLCKQPDRPSFYLRDKLQGELRRIAS